MLRCFALLCLALGACAPSPPDLAAPAVPALTQATALRDAGQDVDAAPAPADAAPADVALGRSGAPINRIYDAVLGQPCAPVHERGGWCAICDRRGRTVGVVLPGDFLYVHGDDVFRRSPDTNDVSPRRLVYRMAVDAHTLRAQVLSCPGCRRQMGWSIAVSLAGLADVEPALRQRLQVALGWPAEPLLGDASAFRAALATPPLRDAPACPSGVLR